MCTKEREEDLKPMRLNRKILHIAFVVPTERISESSILSLLYSLFTPVIFVLYSFILTAQLLGLYFYSYNIDVTMENLFLTLGFIMCFWEGVYFKIKKKDIWKIFDILDCEPLPSATYPELREIHKRDIFRVMSQCKFLSWFIFLSVNVGTLMWAIFPLINLMIHKLSENTDTIADDKFDYTNKPYPYLMYIIWVPYDVSTTVSLYAITYGLQAAVYFGASLYNTCSNIVFLNLVLHATGKFKIIESSLLFLEEVIAKDNQEKMVFNGEEDDTENVAASSDVETFLIDCIKQHQHAITFVHELNFIVSPWIIFSLFIHQLLLVAEVFQLALTAGSGFAILKHFMSIIGVLSQSLLLCWLGDRLIQQSVRVKAAAYSCQWYTQSQRFNRLLLMLIQRSQDPVKFSAGHFYDIDIGKFDQILRRAYSYYAVLREMKES